jgi:hypothetical protein
MMTSHHLQLVFGKRLLSIADLLPAMPPNALKLVLRPVAVNKKNNAPEQIAFTNPQ